MKFFTIFSLALFILTGCDGGKRKSVVADKIYKENVCGVVKADVRILDAKKTRLGYGDYTLWVAFDCSSETWEELKRSKGLRVSSYSLDVPGAPKSTNDTGFEPLLGSEYRVFRNAGTKGVFFVSEKSERPVRVVYFLRDW